MNTSALNKTGQQNRAVVLKWRVPQNRLKGLLKHRLLGPTLRVSNSGFEVGPENWQVPDDTHAAGPWGGEEWIFSTQWSTKDSEDMSLDMRI